MFMEFSLTNCVPLRFQRILVRGEEMVMTLPAAKYDRKENYLVLDVNKQLFGIPHSKIISILDGPKCTAMPGLIDQVSGVIDFMDKPIPLLSFRKNLGLASIKEEMDALVEMLEQRKQDHLNWIAKLHGCVESGTEISVETNPHKCAFGKWYDSYVTENLGLARYLKQFDAPHKRIHNLAVQAKELLARNDHSGALDLIRRAETNELSKLVALFDQAAGILYGSITEYAVVVQVDDQRTSALAVDHLKYFGPLDEIVYPLQGMFDCRGRSFVDAYGMYAADESSVEILIVNLEHLIAQCN
jgi:purine-binding chemotaxis protein CheW